MSDQANLKQQLDRRRSDATVASQTALDRRDDFDRLGTDAAQKALAKARSAESLALEHAARAERLLVNAIEKDKTERRARLERSAASYRKEIDKLVEDDRKLASAQADAVITLVNAKNERRENNRKAWGLQLQLNAALADLGDNGSVSLIDVEPTISPVRQHTEVFINGLDDTDPRRRDVHDIVPEQRSIFGGPSISRAPGN